MAILGGQADFQWVGASYVWIIPNVCKKIRKLRGMTVLRHSCLLSGCPLFVALSLRHVCLSLPVLLLVDCYLLFLTSRVRQSVFRIPFPTILRTTHCATP